MVLSARPFQIILSASQCVATVRAMAAQGKRRWLSRTSALSRAGSSSTSTTSGRAAMMTALVSLADWALTCAVPTTSTRAPVVGCLRISVAGGGVERSASRSSSPSKAMRSTATPLEFSIVTPSGRGGRGGGGGATSPSIDSRGGGPRRARMSGTAEGDCEQLGGGNEQRRRRRDGARRASVCESAPSSSLFRRVRFTCRKHILNVRF